MIIHTVEFTPSKSNFVIRFLRKWSQLWQLRISSPNLKFKAKWNEYEVGEWNSTNLLLLFQMKWVNPIGGNGTPIMLTVKSWLAPASQKKGFKLAKPRIKGNANGNGAR